MLSPIVTLPIVLLLIISSSCTLAVPSPFDSNKSPPAQAPVTLTEPIPTEATTACSGIVFSVSSFVVSSTYCCSTP